MGRYLFDLFGREIAAMIAVEGFRNPTRRPPSIFLPPDCLTKGQPCLICTGCLETESITHHCSTIFIQNDGEHGTGRLTFLIHQPNIEPTMISLPTLVRSTHLMQKKDIVFLLIDT